MEEDHFNMSMRKFLKQVGVTSQPEIERVVRDKHLTRDKLKVKAVLTAEGADLNHVVEGEIECHPGRCLITLPAWAPVNSRQGPPRCAPHAATVE
jgi:Family of unknown function (DUF6494)